MTQIFKDHFSKVAENYAVYRPNYPMRLVDELAANCPGRDRALDCGCGTGQLSVMLAERFSEVVGTDASAAQIGQARQRTGVRYRVALAEDSGIPDASVDLVTVAQAAHWMNLELFYNEVKRVARCGAILALISYGVLCIEGDDVNDVFKIFYYDTISPYWPPERLHVEEGYRSLYFPFREIRMPAFNMQAQWRLKDLVGYIDTWSAVSAAKRARGDDFVFEFHEALRSRWGDPDKRRRVTWPLSMRVGMI